jgi:hypothetical protein
VLVLNFEGVNWQRRIFVVVVPQPKGQMVVVSQPVPIDAHIAYVRFRHNFGRNAPLQIADKCIWYCVAANPVLLVVMTDRYNSLVRLSQAAQGEITSVVLTAV